MIEYIPYSVDIAYGDEIGRVLNLRIVTNSKLDEKFTEDLCLLVDKYNKKAQDDWRITMSKNYTAEDFNENRFVKCKRNGILRYITRKIDNETFLDDGKISGHPHGNVCWYEDYVPI